MGDNELIRCLFVVFYCLTAFVSALAPTLSCNRPPPPFTNTTSSSLLPPNRKLPRLYVLRVARRRHAGGGSGTHAGVGDSEAAACALNWNGFSHGGEGEVEGGGLKSSTGALIYLSGTAQVSERGARRLKTKRWMDFSLLGCRPYIYHTFKHKTPVLCLIMNAL